MHFKYNDICRLTVKGDEKIPWKLELKETRHGQLMSDKTDFRAKTNPRNRVGYYIMRKGQVTRRNNNSRCVFPPSHLNQLAFDNFTVIYKSYITQFKNLKWGSTTNTYSMFTHRQVNMYGRWRGGNKRRGRRNWRKELTYLLIT